MPAMKVFIQPDRGPDFFGPPIIMPADELSLESNISAITPFRNLTITPRTSPTFMSYPTSSPSASPTRMSYPYSSPSTRLPFPSFLPASKIRSLENKAPSNADESQISTTTSPKTPGSTVPLLTNDPKVTRSRNRMSDSETSFIRHDSEESTITAISSPVAGISSPVPLLTSDPKVVATRSRNQTSDVGKSVLLPDSEESTVAGISSPVPLLTSDPKVVALRTSNQASDSGKSVTRLDSRESTVAKSASPVSRTKSGHKGKSRKYCRSPRSSPEIPPRSQRQNQTKGPRPPDRAASDAPSFNDSGVDLHSASSGQSSNFNADIVASPRQTDADDLAKQPISFCLFRRQATGADRGHFEQGMRGIGVDVIEDVTCFSDKTVIFRVPYDRARELIIDQVLVNVVGYRMKPVSEEWGPIVAFVAIETSQGIFDPSLHFLPRSCPKGTRVWPFSSKRTWPLALSTTPSRANTVCLKW